MARQIATGEVVLPCAELDPTLRFFTEELDFRLDEIFPADQPSVAVVSGHGLRLRLQVGEGSPGCLHLRCRALGDGPRDLTAPNGTRVVLVDDDAPLAVPPLNPSMVVSRLGDDAQWGEGRAGMRYRDLLPDRLGGYLVASNIQIPGGGDVADYVHFHEVQFQLIYCCSGWVRVVYEDQGPAFELRPGDCVVQPPGIRHRVLECSPGLEVLEVGCPAEHVTRADHDLELPTVPLRPDRDFSGQRFCRHQAAEAPWKPWRAPGFEARDLGVGAATSDLVSARVFRPQGAPPDEPYSHGRPLFLYVLQGGATLSCEGAEDAALKAGDAVVLPARQRHALVDCSSDVEVFELTLPGGGA